MKKLTDEEVAALRFLRKHDMLGSITDQARSALDKILEEYVERPDKIGCTVLASCAGGGYEHLHTQVPGWQWVCVYGTYRWQDLKRVSRVEPERFPGVLVPAPPISQVQLVGIYNELMSGFRDSLALRLALEKYGIEVEK